MFAPIRSSQKFHSAACADNDYKERRKQIRAEARQSAQVTDAQDASELQTNPELRLRPCARYSCDKMFVPKSINHKFHNESCREAAKHEAEILKTLTDIPDPAIVRAAENELVKEKDRQMGVLQRRLVKEETRTAVILSRLDDYLAENPASRFATYEPRPMREPGKGAPTDVHFLFSDPQGGKWENGIGLKVLLDEYLPLLVEKILSCVEVQRFEGPVDTLFFHLLGDLVEGCRIYPGQRNHLDPYLHGNSEIDQVLVMHDAIGNMLAQLRPNFRRVVVCEADGNHGRQGTKADPSLNRDNRDRLVAEILRRTTRDLDIEWVIPDRDRYVINTMGYHIGGIHGHQLGSKNSLNSMELPLLRWDAIQHFGVQLDALVMGHRHHPASLDVNGIEIIQNGAIDGGSEWFTGSTGAWSAPSQELFFVSEEYFIGTRRRLYVTPKTPRAQAVSRWLSAA